MNFWNMNWSHSQDKNIFVVRFCLWVQHLDIDCWVIIAIFFLTSAFVQVADKAWIIYRVSSTNRSSSQSPLHRFVPQRYKGIALFNIVVV